MVIPVACTCGRTINAPDNMAGKRARCTYCGKPIPIPVPGQPPAPQGPISVTCACGKTLKAPTTFAGKRARCPACGNPVQVPEALPELEVAPPPPPPPPPEQVQPPPPEPGPTEEEPEAAAAPPRRGRLPRRGARPLLRGQAGARR